MSKISDILTIDFVTKSVENGLRSRDISSTTGINDRTVRYYFKKYNLDVPMWSVHKVWNKGVGMEDERVRRSIEKCNAAVKGRPAWNKGLKLPPLTPEHKAKMSKVLKGKYMGDKSSNWKGGASGEAKRIRMSAEYKEWRTSVFKRDNFTCTDCGIKGGELQGHHIKPFSTHIELRFDIDNGLTLCRGCHVNTESWGSRPK